MLTSSPSYQMQMTRRSGGFELGVHEPHFDVLDGLRQANREAKAAIRAERAAKLAKAMEELPQWRRVNQAREARKDRMAIRRIQRGVPYQPAPEIEHDL